MPTRLIDFDALWTSEKLLKCSENVRMEYAWLYGLADANGSFEITSLHMVRAKVAVIRPNLSEAKLRKIFKEFEEHGLLFTWVENNKRYAHWTNSTKGGRLPPPNHRLRYKMYAPAVPLEELSRYEAGHNPVLEWTTSSVKVDNLRTGLGKDKEVGDGAGLDVDTDKDLDTDKEKPRAKNARTDFYFSSPEKPKPKSRLPNWLCPDCHKKIPEVEFLNHVCIVVRKPSERASQLCDIAEADLQKHPGRLAR